ncbi:hypothetical protein JW756_05285 [Candidatus Woesearchaeota archaeon]|nr:hypothetical protein [Candidatus Woesearchaeota archaeon]
MEDKPYLRVCESYLEKSKKFFAEKSRRAFEISALAIGTENDGCVTLTDLMSPKEERILCVGPELFYFMNAQKQSYYDLISTYNRSSLTSSYVNRINGCIKGREHNHPGRRGMPTIGDVVGISELLYRLNPQHSYFIEIIHVKGALKVFYYQTLDLQYIFKKRRTDGINQRALENWLQQNHERMLIKEFEIIKGK